MTEMTARKLKLGSKYRDKIHGLEGTATAHTKYLTGCDQVQLEYLDSEDNIRGVWFDIIQLEGVKPPTDKPGGPKPHAPARSHA